MASALFSPIAKPVGHFARFPPYHFISFISLFWCFRKLSQLGGRRAEQVSKYGHLGRDCGPQGGVEVGCKQRRVVRGQGYSRRLGISVSFRICATQVEVEAGNSLFDEYREVLGNGKRLSRKYIVSAQGRFERRAEPLGQGRIVVHRVGGLIVLDQRLARGTRGCRLGLGDSGNSR